MAISTCVDGQVAWTSGGTESTGSDLPVLVDRARRGDFDAFEQLVLIHQGPLVRFLTHMLSNSADAEDVAQETLLRAYRAIKDFRGQSSFRTWLYQIGANAARTHLERRRIRPDQGRHVEAVPDIEGADQVERRVIAHDQLRRALEQLPDDWREALVLRDVEGLDYREIAEALAIPMGTVESRIFRARQRLKQLVTSAQERLP